eukprot:PhF_6_TR39553/c0_g1_i1/m.58648
MGCTCTKAEPVVKNSPTTTTLPTRQQEPSRLDSLMTTTFVSVAPPSAPIQQIQPPDTDHPIVEIFKTPPSEDLQDDEVGSQSNNLSLSDLGAASTRSVPFFVVMQPPPLQRKDTNDDIKGKRQTSKHTSTGSGISKMKRIPSLLNMNLFVPPPKHQQQQQVHSNLEYKPQNPGGIILVPSHRYQHGNHKKELLLGPQRQQQLKCISESDEDQTRRHSLPEYVGYGMCGRLKCPPQSSIFEGQGGKGILESTIVDETANVDSFDDDDESRSGNNSIPCQPSDLRKVKLTLSQV